MHAGFTERRPEHSVAENKAVRVADTGEDIHRHTRDLSGGREVNIAGGAGGSGGNGGIIFLKPKEYVIDKPIELVHGVYLAGMQPDLLGDKNNFSANHTSIVPSANFPDTSPATPLIRTHPHKQSRHMRMWNFVVGDGSSNNINTSGIYLDSASTAYLQRIRAENNNGRSFVFRGCQDLYVEMCGGGNIDLLSERDRPGSGSRDCQAWFRGGRYNGVRVNTSRTIWREVQGGPTDSRGYAFKSEFSNAVMNIHRGLITSEPSQQSIGSAILVEKGGSMRFSNLEVKSGDYGIYLGSDATQKLWMNNCSVTDADTANICVSGVSPYGVANTFIGNGVDGVFFDGAQPSGNSQWSNIRFDSNTGTAITSSGTRQQVGPSFHNAVFIENGTVLNATARSEIDLVSPSGNYRNEETGTATATGDGTDPQTLTITHNMDETPDIRVMQVMPTSSTTPMPSITGVSASDFTVTWSGTVPADTESIDLSYWIAGESRVPTF